MPSNIIFMSQNQTIILKKESSFEQSTNIYVYLTLNKE